MDALVKLLLESELMANHGCFRGLSFKRPIIV